MLQNRPHVPSSIWLADQAHFNEFLELWGVVAGDWRHILIAKRLDQLFPVCIFRTVPVLLHESVIEWRYPRGELVG